MLPVDAVSGNRSLATARVAMSSTETAHSNTVFKKIPVVQPLPHYPISATVSEITAHISELIKEQRASSQEASHQKSSDEMSSKTVNNFDAGSTKSVDAAHSADVQTSVTKISGMVSQSASLAESTTGN